MIDLILGELGLPVQGAQQIPPWHGLLAPQGEVYSGTDQLEIPTNYSKLATGAKSTKWDWSYKFLRMIYKEGSELLWIAVWRSRNHWNAEVLG
jgi:hypothetical protein